MDDLDRQFPISRFGASSVNHNGSTYIVGGIIQQRLLRSHEEVCCIKYQNGSYSISPVILQNAEYTDPLWIGITLVSTSDSLVILGGSAVCFSFGTFWNTGCYSLSIVGGLDTADHLSTESPKKDVVAWEYMHTIFASTPERVSKVLVTGSLPASRSDFVNS